MKTVNLYGEVTGRREKVNVRSAAECRAAGEQDVQAAGDWWAVGEAAAARLGEPVRLSYHHRGGGMTQRFEPPGRASAPAEIAAAPRARRVPWDPSEAVDDAIEALGG
jgi:hypothetical protein